MRKTMTFGAALAGLLGLALVFGPGRLHGQAEDESQGSAKTPAEVCPLKEVMREVDVCNRKLKTSVGRAARSSLRGSAAKGMIHNAYLIARLADDSGRYPIPEDAQGTAADWKKSAAALRDHAAALAVAAKAGQASKASKAYNSMQRDCVNCHDKFRPEGSDTGGF